MTPDALRDRYDELNARWFGGQLPEVTIRLSRRMATTAGQWEPDAKRITVASRYVQAFPDQVDELLLHEMAHIAARDGHGRKFKAEWQRLRDAGAPVSATYREFRHCTPFAAPTPRPYLYVCPLCGGEFPRTRPLLDDRWCRPCSRRHSFDTRWRLRLAPAQMPLFTA